MSNTLMEKKPAEEILFERETNFMKALASKDEGVLEQLTSPGLIYTSPWGDMVDQGELLDIANSDEIVLEKAEAFDFDIHIHGQAAIVTFYAELEGVFFGEEVEGEFQFIRAWAQNDEGQWQLLTSQCFEEDSEDEAGGDEDGAEEGGDEVGEDRFEEASDK